MQRKLAITVVVLALAGGSYWLAGSWSADPNSPNPEPAASAAGSTSEASTTDTGRQVPERDGRDASRHGERAEPRRGASATPASSPRPSPAARPTRTEIAQMNAQAMQLVPEITGATLSDYETRAQIDGEAAFALFHKMINCANAPDTEDVLLGRIDDIYQGSQNNPDSEKMMDQLSEHFIQKYQDCEGFPRGLDGMLAGFEWLQAAADMRYPPALPAYVSYGKSIVQSAALRYPELVMQFRERVISEMDNMIRVGDPEGFIAYAREYSSGDLLDLDWFLSYAYAHAVSLADANNRNAEGLLQEAERHLTPEQVRDAREHARELCERYCD